MSHPFTLHALPGFLGQPADWDLLDDWNLNPHRIEKHDLVAYGSERSSFQKWSEVFNSQVSKAQEQRILLGYSLGGRLALHALSHAPHLWKGAIFVSTHTGLNCEVKKKERLEHDFQWAERFLHDPWEEVIESWNAQPVFAKDTFVFERKDTKNRIVAADLLRSFSLGLQDSFESFICQSPLPILWIVGEHDADYKAQATNLKFRHPASQIWIAPQSGHRVPWHNPRSFKQRIADFIHTLDGETL